MNKETAVSIHFLDKDRYPQAQNFYESVGYHQPIQLDDLVVAAELDSKISGVVRLAFENDCIVLRGMMVAPTLQRKGVGTMMLRELERHMGSRDVYGI